MSLFTPEVKAKLQELLGDLHDPVHLVYFTQEFECRTCADGRQFVEEMSELSDKLSYEVLDFVADEDQAREYGVDKIPAIVVLDKDKKDNGIRFYGIPGGYEINSFLSALREVSGKGEQLPSEITDRIKAIDKKVHIQVFITMTCPYCPGAVSTAHRLALDNDNITADMVDATVFPELSNRYNVMGVPKIVINETTELVGNQPMPAFLKAMEGL